MSESYPVISLSQIEKVLPLKTWWATVFILPVSRRLIYLLVNKTNLSPNVITVVGLLLRLITALLFFLGWPLAYSVGALLYCLAYVCDCTDGAVARLTGNMSELGRYLDHISDLVGDLLILAALATSQGEFFSSWIWAMAFMHIAECYISYLVGFVLNCHEGTLGAVKVVGWFNQYRQWFFSRNFKSFLSFSDYTGLVFVVFPLFGFPALGLQVGFYLLLCVVCYTVLSTFVSVHSGVRLFP